MLDMIKLSSESPNAKVILSNKDERLKAQIEEKRLMRDEREIEGGRIKKAWEHFKGRGHIDLAKLVSDEDAKVVSLVERRRKLEADSTAAIGIIKDKAEQIKLKQKLQEEVDRLKKFEKEAQEKKKEVELRFNKRKIEVEALEREMGSRLDGLVLKIKTEEGYDVNKERQAKLVEGIAAIKKDLDFHTKALVDLKAIQDQLEQGVRLRDKLGSLVGKRFKRDDFGAVLEDIPVEEGKQLNPATKALREKAKKTITEYRDIDGMSLDNIIDQNKSLLEEESKEVSVLKGKLEKVLKAKEKVDAVCIKAEGRIGKVEQTRRSLDIKKTESKDTLVVKEFSDISMLSKENKALEDDAKTIESRLQNFDTWFDPKLVAICHEKGIDAVPDKINFVKNGISKRNNTGNEVCFKLEESIRRIDKTLEKKDLKAPFKAALEKIKKQYTELIPKIKDIITKPSSEELEEAGDDWGKLKKIALESFPRLKQVNKTESSIEDPKARFKQTIAYMIMQRGELSKAGADEAAIKKNLLDLGTQASKAISEIRDLEYQFLCMETLNSQIRDCIDSGVTEFDTSSIDMMSTIFAGMAKTIEECDPSIEKKILILTKTAVDISKDIAVGKTFGQSESLHVFFDSAYTLASTYVDSNTSNETFATANEEEFNNSTKQITRRTLITLIEDKATEAGLNPKTKELEEKSKDSADINDLLDTAKEMIKNGNERQAFDTLEKALEIDTSALNRAEVACNVLQYFSKRENRHLIVFRDWSLTVLDSAIQDSIANPRELLNIKDNIKEVLHVLGEGENGKNPLDSFKDEMIDRVKRIYADIINSAVSSGKVEDVLSTVDIVNEEDIFTQAEKETMAFDICRQAEIVAKHNPADLEKVALFAFDMFKSEKGQRFVIDIYKTIGDVSKDSDELFETTNKLLSLFEGEDIPYLKETALRMFNTVEEHIPEGEDRTEKHVRLYFVMNSTGVIDYNEAVERYKEILEHDIEDNVTVALETPEVISELLKEGARENLAGVFLAHAQERIISSSNPDNILKYMENLESAGLVEQLEDCKDEVKEKFKDGPFDEYLAFISAYHDSSTEILGVSWESTAMYELVQDVDTSKDLITIAKFASNIKDVNNAVEAYKKAIDLEEDNWNLLNEILTGIDDLPVDSTVKEPVINTIAEKMMNLSEDNLDNIEQSIKVLEGKIKIDKMNELILARMKENPGGEEYNRELADLAIELGFEKAGLEIINSFDSEDTEVHVVEDMEGRRILDSDVESTEPLNEDTLREEVRSSRVNDSKARSAKKRKEKEKPKGILSSIASFFGFN